MKLLIQVDGKEVSVDVAVEQESDGFIDFADGTTLTVSLTGREVREVEAEVVHFDREAQTVDVFSMAFGGLETFPAKIIEE